MKMSIYKILSIIIFVIISGGIGPINNEDLLSSVEESDEILIMNENVLSSSYITRFEGGKGTVEDPYLIRNISDLQAIGNITNLDKHFILANDIDASDTRDWNDGSGFLPIGNDSDPFKGSLDGKGYVISGLYINRSSTRYIGLFSAIGANCSIMNINMKNIYVIGHWFVGGLVGKNFNGSIKNCSIMGDIIGVFVTGGFVGDNLGDIINCIYVGKVEGLVVGSTNIGGFAGNNSGLLENCSFYGTTRVVGGGWLGGLVGFNSGQITNSAVFGDQSISGMDVGGLAGRNTGFISECIVKGNIKSGSGLFVGGLIGINEGSVDRCMAIVNVDSNARSVGGLIGDNRGIVFNCLMNGNVTGYDSIGGLIGVNRNTGQIFNSSINGNVSGIRYMGGFVGYNLGSIWDSYTSGNVLRSSGEEDDYIAGFVAYNERGKIINCYSVCSVEYLGSDNPTDKGFAGSVDKGTGYQMSGNFWDKQVSGQVTSSGEATGKNTDDMMKKETFSDSGWDISHVRDHVSERWYIDDGYDYPRLGWETYVDVIPPHADAGADIIINEREIATFDGSGSKDNIEVLNWTWTFTDKEIVILYGVGPSYRFDTTGVFDVTLVVTDGNENWDTDTMTVTVRDITIPVADAGPDQTVDEGTVVTFDGSNSTDNVGIVNYTWTFIDGDPIVLYGIDPGYRFDTPGVYIVTLNVSDAAGHLATDTMTITVRDITAPIAVAGSDLIVDEGSLVTFDGDGSSDNVGMVNWTWTFIDGDPVVLYGVDPSYRYETPGVYTVVLNVTDMSGHWAIDSMIVTVLDITAPVAVAGSNLKIDEGTVVTLDGGESYDNVRIVNWTWAFLDGDPIVLYGVDPSYRFDNPGVYTVVLNVTDASGLWSLDTITITVRDITSPVADAGADLSIKEGDTVIFDGSGSHDNVGIVNYTWSFYDGSSKVVLYGISPSHTFSIPGIYTVTLTVKDEAGNEGSDTMKVEVKEKEENGIEEDPFDPLLIIIGFIILLVAILILVLFIVFRKSRRRGSGSGGSIEE